MKSTFETHCKIKIPLSIAFLYSLYFSSSAFAEVHLVKMKSIGYEPKSISIKVGDSVQWRNIAYTEHSATADDIAILDTGLVAPKNVSKQVMFSKEGIYKYHCSIHGKTMSGEVNVTK